MNRRFKGFRMFTVGGRIQGPFSRTLAVTAAFILGMSLATPTPSQAVVTGICGPEHALTAAGTGGTQIGFCTKSLTLSATGQLTITLTNTSSEGFIVADAFSVPAGSVTLLSSSNPEFDPANASPGVVLNGAVVVAPFANRAQIISLGGTLANAFETFGGAPNLGVGVGASATFVFQLSDTTGATEQGIFNSELIRFSGFTTLGAPGDRTSVSACSTAECAPAAVPEPSTLWLLGTALVGAGFWSRRRIIVEGALRV